MDWYEFLEQATSHLTDNAEAAALRRELHLHLSLLYADLKAAGLKSEQARELALLRMGSPEEVREAFTALTAEVAPKPALSLADDDVASRKSFSSITRLRLTFRGLGVMSLLLGLLLAFNYPSLFLLFTLTGLGIVCFVLAERLSPVRPDDQPSNWLTQLKHYWPLGAATAWAGGVIGMEPILSLDFPGDPFQSIYSMNRAIAFSIPLTLVAALVIVIVRHHQRKWRWRPYATTVIAVSGYALTSSLTALIAKTLLIAKLDARFPVYFFSYDAVYVSQLIYSIVLLTISALLISSIAAEYRLPKGPAQGMDWRWPAFSQKPWIKWYSRHWRGIASGFVIGVAIGYLPFSGYGSPNSGMITVGTVIMAVAAGVYALAYPLLESTRGIRIHHPLTVASVIESGIIAGQLISATISQSNFFYQRGWYGSIEGFIITTCLLYAFCGLSFAAVKLLQARRQSSSS